MSSKNISAVILAAGKGTRMYSDFPKALHTLAGKPMVQYVIDTVNNFGVTNIYLVYGHGGNLLKKMINDKKINWILQPNQLGTGHAIQQAVPFFKDDEDILTLYGDVPFISVNTLNRLRNTKLKKNAVICLLTVKVDDPTGYGHITRKNGRITGIVECKDATDEQRQIQEVHTGILIANGSDMKRWLSQLTNNNIKEEYYITDIVSLAYLEGKKVVTIHPENLKEVNGVNNRLQLSRLERIYQNEQAEKLLQAGVMLRDTMRFDLRGTLIHGRDIEIDVGVILEGKVTLGHRVKIGAGCIIKNSTIGDDCEINPYSIIENAYIESTCSIGPFTHLRSGSTLLKNTLVGNFVEIKKSRLGKGSKVKHMSYLGDAKIGDDVNIGAGVITCNYDGVNKFITTIDDGAFIGADTQLIAPINIGKKARIAAGTTVTRNVEDNELVLSRVPQVNKQYHHHSSIKKK